MEKTIEIKKVKMNNDSSLTVNFDEVITGETPIVNKFTRDGGGKAHADMKVALNALNVHLMLLTEQAKTKTANTLESISVTGFVIGGDDEEQRGVTLIGRRTLKGNRVLNLVAPFIKFSDEDYADVADLAELVAGAEAEALEYLNGKIAPDAQMSLEFDVDGADVEELS
jgi:hypothetical protein